MIFRFTVTTMDVSNVPHSKECYYIVMAGDVGLKMPAAYSICA